MESQDDKMQLTSDQLQNLKPNELVKVINGIYKQLGMLRR